MVELKKLVGSPLGVLVARYQKIRAFAGCRQRDFSPKSGAPKMPRSTAIDDGPGGVVHETNACSLEEAEDRENDYYDLAIELAPRDLSLGSSSEDHDASMDYRESGLGSPGNVGNWFVYPRPECSGSTIYNYVLYSKGSGSVNADSTPPQLYPNAVTIGGWITFNKTTTDRASFKRRSRKPVNGIFINADDSNIGFSLRVGNWLSDTIDVAKYNPYLGDWENYYSTLGEEKDNAGLEALVYGKARSSVTQMTTNPELTNEHCGGLTDSISYKYGSFWAEDFLPTCYKPDAQNAIDVPSVVFNHSNLAPLIGHYVDLTEPAWLGKYTTGTNSTGPGFMELVLGQWRVISFTVPYNLVPIQGQGGVGGEY